jgi:hypothetical protein
MELSCDVLIVGGGCGGVAAALAASALGRLVVLTEAGSWVGGQLTSQAVPPDEHPWVEITGTTASYRQLRDAVRTQYKQTRRLTETARRDPLFNPGAAWVSNLSAEPEVFRQVLGNLLRPVQARGLLRCLMRHRPVAAEIAGDHIAAVRFEDLRTGDQVTITARYVLDATEEGDLLPLAGCEFVVGAESVALTGEPHALPGPADLMEQQAITWCAALEWRPGEDHTIEQPEGYEFWQRHRARTAELGIPGYACVRRYWARKTVWRRTHTSGRAAELPPSSLCWRLTSEWRLARAPIAPRSSGTPSASAVTESTSIRAQRDVGISTSRPIPFRSPWAPCFRRDWTTCWQPASA